MLHLNAKHASVETSANNSNSLTNSSASQEARRLRSLPDNAPDDPGIYPSDDDGPAQTVGLNNSDWNRACQVAYQCRVANMPVASYDSAFAETVRLMREAGIEFDDATMRTLLRHLVYNQPHSELTARILGRLHRDKALELTHIECAALTLHMLRRLGPVHSAKKIVMAKPVYQAEAYIVLYPEAFAHIMDVVVQHSDFLGDSFLRTFEAAWKNINAKAGRLELHRLLVRTTSAEGRRQALIEDPSRDAGRDARAAVTALSIYAAYLVSFHEGEHRKAFDLLYACEAIHLEARALQRAREEGGGDKDEEDGDDAEGDGGEGAEKGRQK